MSKNKRPLAPVPNTPDPPSFEVGDSFELTEAEKAEVRLHEQRLKEVKIPVADKSLQIAILETERTQLLGACQERSREYELAVRRVLTAHGIDLENPEAGSWRINVDDMNVTRTS